MVHFAEIDPTTNIVKRIIVCESKEWCEKTFGGTWVRTYYRTEGTNFAGIGWTYHPDRDNFSSPQPYPSWTLAMASATGNPQWPDRRVKAYTLGTRRPNLGNLTCKKSS